VIKTCLSFFNFKA